MELNLKDRRTAAPMFFPIQINQIHLSDQDLSPRCIFTCRRSSLRRNTANTLSMCMFSVVSVDAQELAWFKRHQLLSDVCTQGES
jgi:hypothetical protein